MILKSFVQWWNDNPYITFSIGVIGIVGFILGIVFYFKSRVRKKISYSIKMVPIVWRTRFNQKVSKLKFLYDGQEVQSLFASKIVIWNSGELTIENKDSVPEFPLTIELDEKNTIYDASISKVSHSANNFVLKNVSPQNCQLTFNYFDPMEGCSITLLHSGGRLKIAGKIKGLKEFSYVSSVRTETVSNVETNNRGKIAVFISWGVLFSLGIIGAIYKGPAFLILPVVFFIMYLLTLISPAMPKDLHDDYSQYL